MADDPFTNFGGIFEFLAAYLAPDGTTVVPVTLATPMPVALPDTPISVTLPNGAQPVALPTLLPAPWVAATTKDMRNYTGVTVQVHGLSGGDTIQVSESWDGTNAVVQSWVKNDFSVGSTISTDGNYSFIGGGYMTFAKTGSAGTPTLTIAGSN